MGKTVYENLVWEGEYAHGQAFEVNESNGTKVPVGKGYHSLRVMMIQLALEEYPEDRLVRGWGTQAFSFAHERQHWSEAKQVLAMVPIPFAAGLGIDGRVFHPQCFRTLGDERLVEKRLRPAWQIIYTVWPDAFTCSMCGNRTPPKPEDPICDDMRVGIPMSHYEMRQVLHYLPVNPEFTLLRARLTSRLRGGGLHIADRKETT